MVQQVDVIVIGMGPGGESAGAELARAGLTVVGIEARLVGGECPYYGCIPSKMMIRAANALAEARRVAKLAGKADVVPDYAPVAKRIRDEATDDWDDKGAVERFEKAGGQFVRGRAVLTGPHSVRVGGQEFKAGRAIVLNTGTDPEVPPIEGLAGTPFWTNREALRATEPPSSLIVIGGGTIGIELGQAFARFGTRVHILEAGDSLMSAEEPEAGDLIARVLEAEGVDVRTNASVSSVTHDDDGFTVAGDGGKIEAEHVLVATGRRSNITGMGLARAGVDDTARFLETDAHGRVAEGIYAIGDITGKGAFTHMSMYQSRVVTDHILGLNGAPAQYHAVPRVTFTDPEIGAVGMTDKQARESGINVATAVSDLPDSARGWIHHIGNDGFIKLVMDADTGALVGATSAGPMGGEVLSMLTLAVHERTPVSRLRNMIYAYPTFHRAVQEAVEQL